MNFEIEINNCNVVNKSKILLENISFKYKKGDFYLVTGLNGSGKSEFVQALASRYEIKNQCFGEEESFYINKFQNSTNLVSLEEAAKLIEEERNRDESEYMDKEDSGRTARQYICEVLGGSSKKNAPLPEIAFSLEKMEEVQLCGIEKILDRGLRYLSTGEIRRTLLCRALLSSSDLLIVSNPFAGLDVKSRKIFMNLFNKISLTRNLMIVSDRYEEIPESVNMVLEFKNKTISFCGTKFSYETKLLQEREAQRFELKSQVKEFLETLESIQKESSHVTEEFSKYKDDVLVEFSNVNVGWGENLVLRNFNWKVKAGENWLIKGENGSGKTTILELITGNNPQVFREDIKIFGNRRGTGESIWDIKKQLGIVSYRLHVEYRMVGDTSLENVIISGLKDSIGLYECPSDFEKAIAKAWLRLGGFSGKEKEKFASLSYGEQRAILILRAAVKNPKLLILDEPCHGLDENYRSKILALLEKIAETKSSTILHVTHEETEILEAEKNILELLPKENPMYRISQK